mgnify:CR=1 FL=1
MIELQVDRGTGWELLAFDTTPGYDLTTGLGSPKAYQFVQDLAGAP